MPASSAVSVRGRVILSLVPLQRHSSGTSRRQRHSVPGFAACVACGDMAGEFKLARGSSRAASAGACSPCAQQMCVPPPELVPPSHPGGGIVLTVIRALSTGRVSGEACDGTSLSRVYISPTGRLRLRPELCLLSAAKQVSTRHWEAVASFLFFRFGFA